MGYSQKNVADLLNVNRSTYTYYETGKTTPDPMTLNRIAKIFGVPLAEFFPEEPTVAMLRDSDEGPQALAEKDAARSHQDWGAHLQRAGTSSPFCGTATFPRRTCWTRCGGILAPARAPRRKNKAFDKIRLSFFVWMCYTKHWAK